MEDVVELLGIEIPSNTRELLFRGLVIMIFGVCLFFVLRRPYFKIIHYYSWSVACFIVVALGTVFAINLSSDSFVSYAIWEYDLAFLPVWCPFVIALLAGLTLVWIQVNRERARLELAKLLFAMFVIISASIAIHVVINAERIDFIMPVIAVLIGGSAGMFGACLLVLAFDIDHKAVHNNDSDSDEINY